MSNAPEVTWTTNRGKYVYFVHAINTKFSNVAGNYIFGYQGRDSKWYAVYIGQTNDLGARLADHEKLPLAIKNGATHILAHTNSNEQARLAEEADLIAVCQPICNDKLK
ncbi:MAG: hypothetical protein HY370_04125 [Proteobacteria bacterium]|nr:hypothetical protein [Pseudomonadota bacterium]